MNIAVGTDLAHMVGQAVVATFYIVHPNKCEDRVKYLGLLAKTPMALIRGPGT